MADKGKGKGKKDKDCDYGPEPEPKARGGRRDRMPKSAAYPPERTAGLRKFQPGTSGNPGGRPRQYRESVDFYRNNMDEIDGRIMDLLRKDELTKSDEIRLKGLFQAKEFAFGRNPQNVMVTGDLAISDNPAANLEGLSMLLQRARLENAKLEQQRLELKPAPARLDVEDVIAVDSAGEAGVFDPPASVTAFPTEAAPAASTVTEAPSPPFQAEPEPEPAPPPKPKAKPTPRGMPYHAGHAEFRAKQEAEAERERIAEISKRDYGGGQVPPHIAYPASPSRPEVVQLSRNDPRFERLKRRVVG